MPSTSDARRARWPGFDSEAHAVLGSRGFTMTKDWHFTAPMRMLTEREWDALIYLFEEWDYGWGLNNYDKSIHGPVIDLDFAPDGSFMRSK
jgi:hypothetical protein